MTENSGLWPGDFYRMRDTLPAETFRLSFARTTVRVQEQSYVAYRRYRPRFYPGKIKFVRAEIPTDFPADPTAVWAHMADKFEVETVPGDHLGIMSTHYQTLASALSRYVEEALR